MRTRDRVLVVALLLAVVAVQPAASQTATPQAGVSERQEIRLSGARIVGLSPGGTSLAALDEGRLCVYEVAALTEQACGGLEAREITPHPAYFAWSPDSTRIAFVEDFRGAFTDADLWLMEAATGELTNLTDDGFAGRVPIADSEQPDAPIRFDLLPAWAPDGRSIAFSRSTLLAGEFRGNQIVNLDLASGEVETLVSVTRDVAGVVSFGLAWAPDGRRLYYSATYSDPLDPRNGVWEYDAATGTSERRLRSDPEKGAAALIDVATTGQTALVLYPFWMMQTLGASDYYALLDLETNRLTSVHPGAADRSSPAVVHVATFSPDGTKVLYVAQSTEGATSRLLVRELPEGQPKEVATGLGDSFIPQTLGGGLFWAADGTVFLATDPDAGLLFQIESATGAVACACEGDEAMLAR